MDISSDQIYDIVSRSLERIAFVYAEPGEDEAECTHHAHITFDSDDACGDLYLSADLDFLEELASNLLGVETDEVSLEEGTQALTELANIVGGEVISMLGAHSTQFKLGLPTMVEAVPEPSSSARSADLASDFGAIHVRYQTR